ncbi:MAG: phosphopyruvate hydratase [Gammaproteobacteria bacterium]|nr:phosphopyruvate hydratase [Gammaproteobacteria bacterium]
MAATSITDVRARKTFDGCARTSFEVEVHTESAWARAAPSYSDPRSSGKYEIVHFPETGVQGSVDFVCTVIRERLVGMDACAQSAIDAALREIDGSGDFSRIGGNTAEAVSMTVAKAAAASLAIPLHTYLGGTFATKLPHLMLNIIGGGATMGGEGWRGRGPDLQDHLIIPVGFSSTYEALAAISEVFHVTGELIREADPGFAGGRDEEYCWIPMLDDRTCLDILKTACERVCSRRRFRFRLGLDVGASDLWHADEQAYVYTRAGIKRDKDDQARYVADLIEGYDLFYVEDAFFEDHIELYADQCQQFGKQCLIMGDDFLATNAARLETALSCGAVNAAVVKLNMAGTVSETQRFIELCRQNAIATIAAARTYDSPDDTLADLVVGWGATGYKCGSPAGGEHAAKYNRFIRIEEQLGPAAEFAAYPGAHP